MKPFGITTFLYGLLVFAGGLIGHYKAASLASLIAGSLFGIVLLICAFFIFKRKLSAAYLALIITFILDAFFTYRFSNTMKFFPSGMMSVLSLITLIVMALQLKKISR